MKIVLCPVPLTNPLAVMGEPQKVFNALALGCLASAVKADEATRNEEVILLDKEAHVHNLKTLKKDILKENPDILGISVYIWNHQRVMELCAMVKKDNPHIIIVLGGPQVTYNSEEILRENPSTDIIVRGEGEITFCELIEALKKKSSLHSILGITFRHEGRIIHNPDRPSLSNLDEIPSPYLTGILDLSVSGQLELETSRGCPYRCAYCIWHRVHKYPSYNTMERVTEQLKFAYDKGIKKAVLWDSAFDLPERRKALCEYMSREGIDMYLTVFLNPWSVNPVCLNQLKRGGTFFIDIGIQSMNPETLRLINRPAHVERTKKALTLLKNAEMDVICDVILGLPADTFKSVTAEMDVISSLGFGISVNVLNLLPGSQLYETAKENGIIHLEDPPYLVYETSTMSKEELAQAFRYGYFVQQRGAIQRFIQGKSPYMKINSRRGFDSLLGG